MEFSNVGNARILELQVYENENSSTEFRETAMRWPTYGISIGLGGVVLVIVGMWLVVWDKSLES